MKSRFLFLFALLIALALPAMTAAADVTVTGTVNFSTLDGSPQDDDHAANGVFTVNGNLTIQGTVNCNDAGPSSASACAMKFVAGGDFTMLAGSALYAENRTGPGNGGNITVQAGGNVTLQSPAGNLAGAKISSSRVNSNGANGNAGNITVSAGGTTSLQAGTNVSAGSADGVAGTVTLNGQGVMTLAGVVAAGPSGTVVAATKYTAEVLAGAASGATGGTIKITSSTHTQPAVTVTGDAVIVTQGGTSGTGGVTIEGCDVRVSGLLASLSVDGLGARVAVRSGTTITVDGRDVNRANATLGRFGVIRTGASTSSNQGNGNNGNGNNNSIPAPKADLFAQNDISVLGPDPALSQVFSVSSSAGTSGNGNNGNGNGNNNDPGATAAGAARIISTAGAVIASGNAVNTSGANGGSITIASKNDATLNGATLKASGQQGNGNQNGNGNGNQNGTSGRGGAISVRSHSGAINWQNGVGDVRPVGSQSGVPVTQQGTIILTYCTTISTSGTSFPTNGPPVGPFPTIGQNCSPAAPSLPAGEPALPTCNRPPVAANDAYTVAEGGTLNVPAPGVLLNDTDPDGDPITAVLVSGPAHASSFTLNANGSFTYVHDGSETTSDSFTYKASDGSATSNTATVNITVTPVNDVPVANNDTATVAEGGTINMAAPGVLANDTDPDGPAPLTAILVSGPAHASSFVLNPNGSYTYVHDGSETLSDSFTYKASDGAATSNTATVSVTITPVNDPPVANNDGYTVAEGGTLNTPAPGVLGNDTDPDSPTLTAILVSGPAHASSFTLNANGSFTYVHDGSETVTDSFTYKANDGQANSNVATVTITITPVNDAPVAVNDGPYTVAEGGTLSVPAPGVLANDTDVDSPVLTAVLVSGPSHASSFTLNPNGSFTYVHDGSETLTDSFTYRANDGSLNSNVATVSITITPVNDPPTAVNDTYGVNEGGTLNTPAPGVLGNDTDPDSPVLTAVLVSGPSHATSFTLNPNGSFTYVHDGSETTVDSFTYKANDGSADSNVATVTINVTPVNDPPVANNDAYGVNEGGTINAAAPGVLANDTDPDSPTLTAILVSGPAHASSFTLNADGSFTYVHDGSETTSDVFTYKANDGSADSNVATVTITVNPVNDPPVAVNDSYSVNEGGSLAVPAPGVLGNDTDPDSPVLTAILVTGPSHATSFTLNPDGSFTYVHDGSETTFDSFTYKASDGPLTSNVATVSITVNPVNDPPVANNDSYTVAEGGTLNTPAPGVLGNDTDPDSPTLTAILVSGPAHASSFTLNANGSFTYVHDGSETTSDSFTYRANDGSLNSNVATVTITITPVNDPPVAVNDGPYTVAEGGTLSVPAPGVLANDTDVDSPVLTAVLVSGPSHASSFTLNPNGSFTYVHDGSETTSDSFTYRANDGSLNSNVATVSIAITPVNDPPTAVNDTYGVNEGGTLNTPAPGVLGNDTDPDSPVLTAVLVSGPSHATSFTLNPNGSFTYVHDGSETMVDSFTYKANDGAADSNVATVTINVTPVNDPPVANNDAYGVNEGGTINAAAPGVLANDTDPDSPTLTAILVSGPAHASSFTLNADGSFTYVHDGSETTSDVFTYKANDGSADSNVATVTITVNPVNDPPVAVNDSYSVNEGGSLAVPAPGVLGNDTDPDSPVLTAILVSGPSHATSFTLNPDGSFTYVHDGSETTSDSFTYKASDGPSTSNVATVTITVNPVNDPPVANNDAYNVNSNGSITVPPPGVLSNDTDPDSPTLTAVLVSGPTHAASFALNPNGGFSYTPAAGFTGTDVFTYKANDGLADSNVATVTLSVIAQPPTAVNDSYLTIGNTQLRVGTGAGLSPAAQVPGASVLDNDTDPDTPHAALLVSTFDATSAAGGSITMTPSGNFNYLPPVGYIGTDTFHYTVTDGIGSSTGLVTITISNRVWYVKNNAAPGDGRSTSPFNNLASAGGGSSLGGDYIYVHTGNGTTNNQNAGITLKNNQLLVGEGVALIVGPYTLNPAGAPPNIGNSGGAGVTLANGNTVTGLNVTGANPGISGSSVNGGTIAKVAVSGAGNGIDFSAVTGTWNLSDVTAATAGSGTKALSGTGTGTLNVSGASSLSATNGTAADINGMVLGVTLVSASASNAGTGIRLQNTTGSFTVTGSGTTAGSGGAIANMTSRGAQFLSATNITLRNMNFTNAATTNGDTAATCGDTLNATNLNCSAAIHFANVTGVTLAGLLVDGSAQIGINGNAVTGLSMNNVEVRNAGNEVSEHGAQFANLFGTVSVTGSNFHNNFSRQFTIQNGSGTLNATISNSSFTGNGILVATGAQGALISGHGTAALTVNVSGSTFNNNFSNGYFSDTAASSTLNATLTSNTFNSNNTGVVIAGAGSGAVTYDVNGNTFTNMKSIPLTLTKSSTSNVTGFVRNNIIGTTGVPASGCSAVTCDGIDLNSLGSGTHAITVTANSITGFDFQGIRASAQNGGSSMQLKISGNTVASLSAGATNGIFVQSGAASADTTSVCADIFSNTVTGLYAGPGFIRVRNRFVGTAFRLPGYAGAGNDTAAVAAFISGQNGAAPANATINANVFAGGAACATP